MTGSERQTVMSMQGNLLSSKSKKRWYAFGFQIVPKNIRITENRKTLPEILIWESFLFRKTGIDPFHPLQQLYAGTENHEESLSVQENFLQKSSW